MRKFCANYIFSPEKKLLRYGIVVVSDNNLVDVIDTGGVMREIEGLEFHSGLFIVGDIEIYSFNKLRAQESSFQSLFDNITSSNKSLIHISNINFAESKLKTDTVIKRYL